MPDHPDLPEFADQISLAPPAEFQSDPKIPRFARFCRSEIATLIRPKFQHQMDALYLNEELGLPSPNQPAAPAAEVRYSLLSPIIIFVLGGWRISDTVQAIY